MLDRSCNAAFYRAGGERDQRLPRSGICLRISPFPLGVPSSRETSAVRVATDQREAKGFDAGIGPRDRAPADMIAVRVIGPMKIVVVGTPTYFARRRPPDDLARHSCVQYRLVADGAVLAWPFEWNRKSRRIAVDGQVIINDADLAAPRKQATVIALLSRPQGATAPAIMKPPAGSSIPSAASLQGSCARSWDCCLSPRNRMASGITTIVAPQGPQVGGRDRTRRRNGSRSLAGRDRTGWLGRQDSNLRIPHLVGTV
jgi:hypothetical protein